MGKSSIRPELEQFQADLAQFVEFFGQPDNRRELLDGPDNAVRAMIERCPRGAALVLAVGLRAKDNISDLAQEAGVADVAEQALALLQEAEGRRPLLEDCLATAGKCPGLTPPGARVVFMEPVFDIQAGELSVHWIVRLPGGRTHESVDSPSQLLPLFPSLGEAVRKGWEGMKKLGWSMPEDQAREYATILKRCADTVERLSSLLPQEVVKAPLDASPQ